MPIEILTSFAIVDMEKTAIVIGGGMGGLATAQVLSKHFSSVVLIEKDQPQSLQGLSAVEVWRQGIKARPGVTQVTCMHTCNKHSGI